MADNPRDDHRTNTPPVDSPIEPAGHAPAPRVPVPKPTTSAPDPGTILGRGMDRSHERAERADVRAALRYPAGFPEPLEEPVEAARQVAERAFRKKPQKNGIEAYKDALELASLIFTAHARQACIAGREGVRGGAALTAWIDEGLEFIARHVYRVAGLRTWSEQDFVARVGKDIRESVAWDGYISDRFATKDISTATAQPPLEPVSVVPEAIELREAPEGFKISEDIVAKRRAIVDRVSDELEYSGRREQFAKQHLHVSVSALNGIIREERDRGAIGTRDQIIRKLGSSFDEWYGLE